MSYKCSEIENAKDVEYLPLVVTSANFSYFPSNKAFVATVVPKRHEAARALILAVIQFPAIRQDRQ
jgi:hypothetical protein